MNVAGIIMECNPFHEGHAHVLAQTRQLAGADYVVAVMSGDYVQRGEPAILDKYYRAEQVLVHGADLVLELPLYTACQSAEFFARGSVALLDRLGVVTDLCFGSESGDTLRLSESAEYLEETESSGQAEYRQALQKALRAGKSFPAARSAAIRTAAEAVRPSPAGQRLYIPSSPNDLLAVEYCRAIRSAGSAMRPHAIRRIDAPSATDIRRRWLKAREEALRQGDMDTLRRFSASYAGESASSADLHDRSVPFFPVCPDDFSGELLYALRMQQDVLEDFVDVTPDLADRIRRLLPCYHGFSDFCDLLKSRNYTRTRISRCLLHILLQIRGDRLKILQTQGMALYARPLALRKSAAPLLSAIHAGAKIPFLSRLSGASQALSADALSLLREEMRAEELYTLTLRNQWEKFRRNACRNHDGRPDTQDIFRKRAETADAGSAKASQDSDENSGICSRNLPAGLSKASPAAASRRLIVLP